MRHCWTRTATSTGESKRGPFGRSLRESLTLVRSARLIVGQTPPTNRLELVDQGADGLTELRRKLVRRPSTLAKLQPHALTLAFLDRSCRDGHYTVS